MRRDIIYDCDSVLLNYYLGFSMFLLHVCGIVVRGDIPQSYDMMEWVGVDDRALVIDLINRFNSNEGEYFANLEPLPGAVDAVLALREAGHLDSVLTACNKTEKTKRGRISNLDNVFGGFSEVRFVDLHESKRAHLEALPKSWFVEDNIANARLGSEIGHDTLLIEYPHNADPDEEEGFHRVQNWLQIHNHIGNTGINMSPGFF